MSDLILTEDFGPVRRLTLNSPSKLNALSQDMLDALDRALDRLEADAGTTRVAVIRGAGKGFCAGHDLAEIRAGRNQPDKGKETLTAFFDKCSAIMTRIPRLPQPLIASVHGVAAAAGCQLVATCDLAVATRSARFGVNGVDIGLFCSTPMVALTRNIPAKHAFEMLTTGEFVTAQRAVELGLANRVADDDQLEVATMRMANTIADKLGAAVKIGKRAFYEQMPMSLEDAYAHTGRVIVENIGLDDTAEGIAAFLEKRDPDWHQ